VKKSLKCFCLFVSPKIYFVAAEDEREEREDGKGLKEKGCEDPLGDVAVPSPM
jgi:hypothetical protein